MHRLLKTVLVATLMVVFTASMASAAGWTETWESYTSGDTPYDNWVLGNGTWMGLGTPNHTAGGTQSYKITAGSTSRIGKNLGFTASAQDVIVVDGWFYDSSGASSSKRTWLGIQNEFAVDTALARIGCNNAAAGYQFHYYTGGALQIVQTGAPNETGWHYTKLVFTKQPNGTDWKIDWRVDKTGGQQYTGSVTYAWGAATATKVVVGYNYSTTVEVDWDDISVSGTVVPEPSGMIALGTGLLGVGGLMRRRRA